MEKRAKIIVSATAVAIISLMITAYLAEQQPPPNLPTNRPVSELVEVNKAYTPRTETKPIVAQEMPQISTQTEECTEPTPTETSPPQPTGNIEPTVTPTPITQTATKANATSTTKPPTTKNGDIRIVDGQQQGYLLGFGWVDNMGENECIYVENMYENGNKIGVMY